MDRKTLLCLAVGIPVFLAIWLYNMLSGVTLLIGFGFGILLFKPVNNIFKNFQRNVYLSEKAEMAHRKVELERELEKLGKEN